MAQDPLKPLIQGMLAMILIVAAVFFVHALRQVMLEEQRRIEANDKANKAMQEKWRQEREAAELQARRRREEAAAQSAAVAQARARDRAALDALQAKKRPMDVGAAFGRLRRKAEGGDPDAQALMGYVFLRGMNAVITVDPSTHGVTASTKHASALIGEDIGPRMFDTRFESVPILPANRAQGLQWYERAASQGHRGAQASLAAAHVGHPPSAFLGYKWALIATKTPWPKDFISMDGDTQASVERARVWLESQTAADIRSKVRAEAEAFKPTPESPAPSK